MFNFITNFKIKNIINSKKELSFRKIPKYLNNKNLLNFGYSLVSFSENTNEKYREILLKVYRALRKYDEGIFIFFPFSIEYTTFIPIINKKNTELLGIIYNSLPSYTPLISRDPLCNVILKTYIKWLDFLEELNNNNIVMKNCISLQNFTLDFFENFTYSENVDLAEQEKIISLSIFNSRIKEKYEEKQLFLFFPSKLVDYLKNISISSKYAIGYENLRELIRSVIYFDAPNVVTVQYDKLGIDFLSYTKTKLGYCYTLCDGIVGFIFDDKLGQEYIKDFLFNMFKEPSYFNCINTSEGPIIIYDKDKFEIKGYLCMNSTKPKKFDSLNKIKSIIYLLSDASKIVDISKLSSNSISFVKTRLNAYNISNLFLKQVLSDHYTPTAYDVVISCHEQDLFIRDNDPHDDSVSEILRICFEYLFSDKSKKKLIHFLPENIKSLYNMYIKSGKVLKISKLDAKGVLSTLNKLCSKYTGLIPITKFSPLYINSGEKIQKKGYEFAKCTESDILAMLKTKKNLNSFSNPKISFVVYEDNGNYISICGVLYKKSKRNYIPITSLVEKNTFFKSNYGILFLHLLFEKFIEENPKLKKLPENIGIDTDTYEFGIDNIWSKEELKVSYIRKLIKEIINDKVGCNQFYPYGVYEYKGVFYLTKNGKMSITSSVNILQNLLLKGNLVYCKEHNVYYNPDYNNICPNCLKESILIGKVEELEDIIGKNNEGNLFYSYNLDDITIPEVKFINNNFAMFGQKIVKKTGKKYEIIGYTYKINLLYNAVRCGGELANYSNRDVLGIVLAIRKFEQCLPEGFVFPWYAVTNIFRDFCVFKEENGLNYEIVLKNLGLLSLSGPAKEENNFYQFLSSISQESSYINPNLSIKELEEEYLGMSAFCMLHNTWFNPNDECAECKKEKDNWTYFSIVGKDAFRTGGESNIYEIDKDYLLKVWKSNKVLLNLKYQIVKKLISESFVSSSYSQYSVKFMLPHDIYKVLVNDGECTIGYKMEKVENAKPLRNLEDINIVNEFGFELSDILKILINLGMGISYLHEKGWYIGDLSGNNILFKQDCSIYILDCDSFGCDTIKSTAFTPGYVDPLAISKENELRTSKSSDYYSYAVLAFLILTRMHPFKGVYYLNNGKRITDPTERMKNGVSVLGDHNVKLPRHINEEVAWGWMSDSLKKCFLEIFESHERFNIVNALIEEHKKITNKSKFEGLIDPVGEVRDSNIINEVQVFKANFKKVDISEVDHTKIFLGIGKDGSNRYLTCINCSYEMPQDYIIKYSNLNNTKGYIMIMTTLGFLLGKFSSKGIKDILKGSYCDISRFDFIISGNENNDVYYCVHHMHGTTVKFETTYTFDFGKVLNILSDCKNKQFFVLSREKKKAYIIDSGLKVNEVDMSTFPECIMTKNNYCFYNSSLYIPMDGKIFCKNVFNGKEKIFEVACLVANEIKTLISTPSGFRAFSSSYILDITS